MPHRIESAPPNAIDVAFEPVRRSRRVGPAEIVTAEALRSQQVTPVMWLRVAEAGAERPALAALPQVSESALAAVTWMRADTLADPADAAASVSVSLETARRASFDGHAHAHRDGDCGFCRRAVAAYR